MAVKLKVGGIGGVLTFDDLPKEKYDSLVGFLDKRGKEVYSVYTLTNISQIFYQTYRIDKFTIKTEYNYNLKTQIGKLTMVIFSERAIESIAKELSDVVEVNFDGGKNVCVC